MTATGAEPPKLEYPCPFPLKIIGRASADFQSNMLAVVAEHAELEPGSKVVLNPSSKGRFVALRLVIVATGESQIEKLHQALKATGQVQMVM